MNKERIATQRLADIKALITYVKEGIDELYNEGNSQQLDDMGSSTLTMLATLQDIQTGLGKSEELIVESHNSFSQKNFEQIEEPLRKVIAKLDTSSEIQKKNIDEIVQAYNNYTDSFKEVRDTIIEHQEKSIQGRQQIEDNVTKLGDTLKRINQEVPTKEGYQKSLQDIKDMIQQLVTAERKKVNQNEKDLKMINSELKISHGLIIDTNRNLEGIQATYEESTARLSVIDSKVDSIIDMFKQNKPEDQAVGGINNEEQ